MLKSKLMSHLFAMTLIAGIIADMAITHGSIFSAICIALLGFVFLGKLGAPSLQSDMNVYDMVPAI